MAKVSGVKSVNFDTFWKKVKKHGFRAFLETPIDKLRIEKVKNTTKWVEFQKIMTCLKSENDHFDMKFPFAQIHVIFDHCVRSMSFLIIVSDPCHFCSFAQIHVIFVHLLRSMSFRMYGVSGLFLEPAWIDSILTYLYYVFATLFKFNACIFISYVSPIVVSISVYDNKHFLRKTLFLPWSS